MKWHWAQYGLAVLCAAAVGVSTMAIGAKQHTKTVTRTVVKAAPAPRFNGKLSSLVAFLAPKTGGQVKCPHGTPANGVCFQFASTRWYVFFAAPADAVS